MCVHFSNDEVSQREKCFFSIIFLVIVSIYAAFAISLVQKLLLFRDLTNNRIRIFKHRNSDSRYCPWDPINGTAGSITTQERVG